MKTHFLNIFLLLICCLSCNYGYGETVTNKQETQGTTANPIAKPPKNYLDIKVDEKERDHFLNEFINMLTTLGVIVAVILIATWFLKKMVHTKIQQLNTTSVIKIVERRTLTPKTSLYLLDIKGVGFIVAESINGVTSLGSFDVNEVESQQPASFKNVMKNKSDEKRDEV